MAGGGGRSCPVMTFNEEEALPGLLGFDRACQRLAMTCGLQARGAKAWRLTRCPTQPCNPRVSRGMGPCEPQEEIDQATHR